MSRSRSRTPDDGPGVRNVDYYGNKAGLGRQVFQDGRGYNRGRQFYNRWGFSKQYGDFPPENQNDGQGKKNELLKKLSSHYLLTYVFICFIF